MILKSTLTPLLLAAAPAAVVVGTTGDATLDALRGTRPATSLEALRAGAPVVHELGGDVRSELQRAQKNASSELAAMRGGELTDRELMIIGITVLAVILLIIIL